MYRHVGNLQYLSFTRPDISFSVYKVSKFMYNPWDTHWQAVERISGLIHVLLDNELVTKALYKEEEQ